jgi:predicted RNA binding protein YcfA (HicA-like mRNA interferase family)
MNAKEIIKELEQDGWKLVNVVGSHHQFKHPAKPGKVTVSVHKGEIHPKTLRSIRKQAGLL